MIFRGKLIVIVGQEGQLVLDNGESIPLFRVGTLGRGFDSIQIQSGYDILRTHNLLTSYFY